MEIKEITMRVTRVQYQDIIVSAENGFDMPETANDLIETVESMKNSRGNYYIADKGWYSEDPVDIININIVEG